MCKTAATGLVGTECQGVGSETTANLKADLNGNRCQGGFRAVIGVFRNWGC